MNNYNHKDIRKSSSRSRRILLARRRRVLTLAALMMTCMLSLTVFISSKAGSAKDQKFKYYTKVEIQEGDTLWSIADLYLDYTMNSKKEFIAEVKSINHLKDTDHIVAGKILIIPYYSSDYICD